MPSNVEYITTQEAAKTPISENEVRKKDKPAPH